LGAISQSLWGLTASAQEVSQASTTLEEIVVTSQRREEKISDVPLSISAFGQERLDAQGVRSIDEIARLTPGITFSRTDQRNGAASNISIRGISSSAGTSTTGIYIDDTPIQVRTLGYASFNTFPQVFDIERVEILRGPQGTLFGAGSEGGTVRFITPEPNLTRSSSYVRSEIGYTEGGGESYEAGGAFGGPIGAD
jgi:outer membrane receptor protein involved in Fe transport